MFKLIASWRHEEHWRLADYEARDLAEALAHAIESMPENLGGPVKAFLTEWSPYIGCLLAYQVVIETRVNTSKLAGRRAPALRAMPGGRVADPRTSVPPAASERTARRLEEVAAPPAPPLASADVIAGDTIPVPESRPGSLKEAHDEAEGLPIESVQL